MQPRIDKSEFYDDKKLLSGCVKGDQNAWNAFLERYSGLIFHAISGTLEKYSFVAKNQVLDDLFQRVFLSLLEARCKKFRQFRWKCKLSTWLYTVTVRMTIDYARKEGLAPPVKNDVWDSIPNQLPLPDTIVEMKEESVVFEKIKEKLSPREQFFLKLCYDQELPVAEIAGILHITENNVYQLKNRVTLKMKKILDGFL
jgi:RNA polymerase sigma-70 factor, ECF subfamily